MLDVGSGSIVPLLEADVVYAPLHRTMAACLTRRDESQKLNLAQVVQLNNASWRNAHGYIAAHPDED